MTHDASGEYFRNSVLTATPEQLQLMLYDGAIRFATQAREFLQRKDFENSCETLLKAQRIVLQMQDGLRPEVNPELVGQLMALYQFVHRRLVDANMRRSTEAIDDALQILHHQRETWAMLLAKFEGAAANADAAASAADIPTESLSLVV